MKDLVVILVVIGLSQVYGECPRKEDLHCNFYDTENCPPGTKVRNTFINYNGRDCDACRMCLPESAQYGCPEVQCPYNRIEDMYPMDCAVFKHPQRTRIDGQTCEACATFTKDCSDISWTG